MSNKTFNDVKINVTFTKAANATGLTHADNISGSPSAQDLALALGKIQNWYDNWHSVVWTGDAATVNGKTVAINVPSNAVFTDHITTATTSGDGNAVTSVTADASGALTITKGSTFLTEHPTVPTDTDTTSSDTPGAGGTFTAVDSVTRDTNGHVTKINTKTITLPSAIGDTKVTQNILASSDNTNYPLLLSYYDSTSNTTTAQTANRSKSIYANPKTGTITATNFAGTVNGYTISASVLKAVPADAVFTDTTYTFTGGVSGAYFQVTEGSGQPQTVYISGLGTMAFESTGDFVSAKPDGTHDLLDSTTHIINSAYLPSYVDDVIEGYYNPADHKFYTTRTGTAPNYSYSGEIAGETGKIYLDLGEDEAYRWGGTAYVSLKQPTLTGVANVVAGSNNGDITVSYNDGSTSSTFTVYSPEGNFIPTGGSSGKILGYGGSSGTAAWVSVSSLSAFTGAADSSHAGTAGIVPAPAASTYASPNHHYLRSDATWSDDPVIEADTLTLNVIAGS